MLVGSIIIWIIAIPTGWIYSPAFISHASMAALVYTAVSAIHSATAAERAKKT